jgi:hypothetical protein
MQEASSGRCKDAARAICGARRGYETSYGCTSSMTVTKAPLRSRATRSESNRFLRISVSQCAAPINRQER